MGKNRIRILLISGFGILLLSSHLYAAVSRKNVLWLSPYGNAVVYNLDFKFDKYIITPGQPWKHFNVGYDKVDGKMKITVECGRHSSIAVLDWFNRQGPAMILSTVASFTPYNLNFAFTGTLMSNPVPEYRLPEQLPSPWGWSRGGRALTEGIFSYN